MISISAVVITRNEEKNIPRCLESLTFADEILVVDAESEDRTVEICEDPSRNWAKKVRVVQRPWSGFRDQRNYAMEIAKHDWLFVIDADETCSPELAARMKNLATKTPPHRAYKVRRIEYFLGKPIHHGIWNPSYQDRFFHRAGVKYINDIHEYPVFPTQPQEIHEPIHHSPAFEPEKFLKKMNEYTSIEARERVRNGQRTHFFRLLFAFPAMFLKNYLYYGAFKDGMHGFVISLLEGVSRVVRHIKIWQYSRGSK